MGAPPVCVTCRLLWKLARLHGWGAPVDVTTLVDAALPPAEQGRRRDVVERLVDEPYVGHVADGGYFLKNDPDSEALAAVRLRSTCGYSELQIEATLSRFEQAGGFESCDVAALGRSLEQWL